MIGQNHKEKLDTLLGHKDAEEVIVHLKNLEAKYADDSIQDVEDIVSILTKKIPKLSTRYDELTEKKNLHPLERLKVLTYVLKSYFHEE